MMENQAPPGTKHPVKARWLVTYRRISLGLAIVFAGVGLLFLLLPGAVLHFFNNLSVSFGLQSSPVEDINFYLILAIGYMYIVAMLAWFMFRQPENHYFPILLLNAKLASSILSLIFFFSISHALIYLVNGVVDGLIGAAVHVMYRKQRRLK
jgi:hypothetical protein